MTDRRCLRCPATTTALHGLCSECIAVDVARSRAAQGLPARIPANADVFAQIDALTRPLATEQAA